MRTALAITIMSALGAAAHADDDDDARAALARLEAAEPRIADTVAAALREAGLAGRPEARLGRRARLAAALPTVSLRARRDTGWAQSDPEGKVVGDVQRDDILEARLTWRLDRLVFDSTDVRVLSLGQQRARARAALAAQVTALYYKRRDLEIEAVWHPPQDAEAEARREADLDELGAQLDGLTGGWWSAHEAAR